MDFVVTYADMRNNFLIVDDIPPQFVAAFLFEML